MYVQDFSKKGMYVQTNLLCWHMLIVGCMAFWHYGHLSDDSLITTPHATTWITTIHKKKRRHELLPL